MKGWNGFDIAEPILRVMAEKGFKEPTEIQALTFPAAIMGRRDILGAAETGHNHLILKKRIISSFQCESL